MDSTKTISLAQAFAHCASTGSYWLWIAIACAISGAAIFLLTKANNKSEVNPILKIVVYFAVVVAIFCAVFIRPTSVCQNTSEEMAARGDYLGY